MAGQARQYHVAMNIIINWLLNGVALWLTALVGIGISFNPMTVGSVLVAALILGLVNALVRPVMLALALPINVLTLGLFTLVVNAIVLYLVAWLSPAMEANGFFGVLIAAVVLSIISSILSRVFGGSNS